MSYANISGFSECEHAEKYVRHSAATHSRASVCTHGCDSYERG